MWTIESGDMAVLGKWIGKHCGGFLKRDAMLRQIRYSLVFIPLEAFVPHAISQTSVLPNTVDDNGPSTSMETHRLRRRCYRWWYSRCSKIYRHTSGGARKSIGRPSPTRWRMSVALMSICGTSTTFLRSF